MNPNVGSNQGTSYDKVEGNAKAFILKGDNKALDAANNVADLEINLLAKQKADKEKALLAADAKKKEAAEKLKSLTPDDLWHKHQAEMQGQYDGLIDKLAQLQGAGVTDPFSATDEASRLFQKEFALAQQMAASSQQLKEQHMKDRAEINANPSRYTDDSKLAVYDFYNANPLRDIVSKSLLPPQLRPTQPMHDKTKYYQTIVDARGKETEPTDLEMFDFAKTALTDQGQVGYLAAMEETYDKLPAKEKERLAKLAEANGISFIQGDKDLSPLVVMAKEEIKPYFSTKPIDIDQLIVDNMPAGDIVSSATSYENMAGVTTSKSSRSKTLDEEKLDVAARGMLSPKLLDQLIQDKKTYSITLNGKPETITVSNEETAKEFIKQQMRARFQSEKETKSGTAIDCSVALDKETGIGKEILDKDQDFYYQSLFNVNTPEKAAVAKKFGYDLNKPEDATRFQASMYQQAAQAAIGMPRPDGTIVKDAKVVWKNRNGQIVQEINPKADIMSLTLFKGTEPLFIDKSLKPELVLQLEQPVTETSSGTSDAGDKKSTTAKTVQPAKTIAIELDAKNPDATSSQATELNRIYQYKVKKTGTGFGYNRKGELGGQGSDVNTRFEVEQGKPIISPTDNNSQNKPKKRARGGL